MTALVAAVQEQEAETRIMTVTTIKVPFPELERYYEVADMYVIPSVKENPHILSYRMGNHAWGSTRHPVWVISEYENMDAIQESQEWGNDWFEEHYPEGTAARDSADAALEEGFLPYFSDHADNIATVNMTRIK